MTAIIRFPTRKDSRVHSRQDSRSRFETESREVGYGFPENMLIGVCRLGGFLCPTHVGPDAHL